jgi:hypothetical protein
MPLARIIARDAENAHILAKDLRARGYEVQTRSPEEKSSEPADLEITLEDCTIEEAVSGAAHVPVSPDLYVFIAPGAVSENLRPIRIASLIPEAIAAKSVLEMKAEPRVRPALAECEPPVLEPTTSIGDLGSTRERAENGHAMTLQAEGLETQVPESNLIPMNSEIISPLGDQEAHLDLRTELQDLPSEQESVIMQGDEPVSGSAVGEPVPAEERIPEEPQPVAFESEVVAETSARTEARMEPEPMAPLITGSSADDKDFPSFRVRIPRMSRNEKLFWKIAPLTAMLVLAFLLLAVSAHRFSPVPPGLAPSSGDRQSVPFAKVKSDKPIAAPTKSILSAAPSAQTPMPTAAKPTAAEPLTINPLTPKPLLSNSDRARVGDGKVTLATSSERVVASKPSQYSASSAEGDYVAKDTIVRYGAASGHPAPSRRQPAGPSRKADFIAKDTVVHYGAHSDLPPAPSRK